MQIEVVKANGSYEPYLHTKVLGTLHRVMAQENPECLQNAEMLADAVTFYLYHVADALTASTEQIHQWILKALEGSGYRNAAELLTKHRLERYLRRCRVEVIDSAFPRWDKGHIVLWLMGHYGVDELMARTIAGAVEEQVLHLGLSRIRKSLVSHLVTANAESLFEAQQQLDIGQRKCATA